MNQIKTPRDLVISAGYSSLTDFTKQTGVPYTCLFQTWGRNTRWDTITKLAPLLKLDPTTLRDLLFDAYITTK